MDIFPANRWFFRQPWKALLITALLIISPATGGGSLLLMAGLYWEDLTKPIFRNSPHNSSKR